MNKAFRATVITGLQMFMALSLRGRPAEEVIEATVEVWLDLLYGQREHWDSEDLLHLQTAFKRVGRSADQWPTPAQVIRAMPAKIVATAATPRLPASSAQKAYIDKTLSDLLAQLKPAQVDHKLPKTVNIMREKS